jgi:hypothetical protein
MTRLVLVCLCLALLCACWEQHPIHGCGTAGRPKDTVQIATESAILVWDAGSKVQHFIRRATFHTDTPDFGFLVPTPSQPTLAEAKDEAFSLLHKLTAPEVVKDYEYLIMPPLGCGAKEKKTEGGPPDEVRVLDERRVAGYDAAVLEADSATALNAWLAKHDYVTRPDLAAWLDTYVKVKWKITAFKIAKDAKRDNTATSAVLMSFTTDRPFFPYSEPADQRDEKQQRRSRLLRVFFLGEQRFDGKLGDEKQAWPGRTVWAGALKEEPAHELSTLIKLAMPRRPVWLTVFDDDSSPRPGTADVYFYPSASQEEVRRPPIHIRERVFIGGWLCLGLFVATSLLLGIRLFRRRVAG